MFWQLKNFNVTQIRGIFLWTPEKKVYCTADWVSRQHNSVSVISVHEHVNVAEWRGLPVLHHAAVHTPSAPRSRHFALHHSTLRPNFTPQKQTHSAGRYVVVSAPNLSQTEMHQTRRGTILERFCHSKDAFISFIFDKHEPKLPLINRIQLELEIIHCCSRPSEVFFKAKAPPPPS